MVAGTQRPVGGDRPDESDDLVVGEDRLPVAVEAESDGIGRQFCHRGNDRGSDRRTQEAKPLAGREPYTRSPRLEFGQRRTERLPVGLGIGEPSDSSRSTLAAPPSSALSRASVSSWPRGR